MKRHHSITLALGVAICAIYLSCASLAFLRYPESYSPSGNWLSDLGNRAISPEGSKYYNIGVMVSGGLLILFFLSLRGMRLAENRRQRVVLTLSQASGVIGAAGMILSGVFSIDTPSRHSVMSAILRIGVGTAFGFTVPALVYHRGVRRWILVLGAATTLLDLVVSALFNKTRILEWPVILLFLVYCIVLGGEAGRLQRLGTATA
jgi:hypothetical membrane protein